MKKLISILLLAFAIVFVTSEVKAQAVTNTLYVVDGSAYGSFWGATTDTVIASGYRIQPIRVKGDALMTLDVQLSVTKISGTVTNNFIFQKSMDNVNWVGVDTIKLVNASTGVNYKQITGINYPYMRFYILAPATTQKAWYKAWYVIRKQ